MREKGAPFGFAPSATEASYATAFPTRDVQQKVITTKPNPSPMKTKQNHVIPHNIAIKREVLTVSQAK